MSDRNDRHQLEALLLKTAIEIIDRGYRFQDDDKEYCIPLTPKNIGIVYDELRDALHHPI